MDLGAKMGFIKNFFIKRALKTAASKSEIEKIADDVLKNSMQELQQTNRTANKILQSKLIRQESQHALNKIHELDNELEEGEEPEAPQSMEEMLMPILLTKLLGGSPQTPPPTPSEIIGYDDEGKPMQAPQKQNNLSEIASKLSPADIQSLKDKFLK